MQNIAYLIKESHMSYEEVINLPYNIFLSLLKHFQIFELQESAEGRAMLEESRILQVKEPDWNRIRQSDGYKAK